MRKYRPFLIIAVALLAAVVGGFLLMRSGENEDSFPVAPISPSSASPGAEPQGKPSVDAVVTLEEFGANLNFVFRNLPLSTIHKNALAAAQAAEAARVQNRFWEMHDLLYENQDLWKDDINPRTIFIKFAGDLGLDNGRFVQDMDDKQVKMRIEADQFAAAELGINGTPTFLIDGRQLRPEVTNPEGIRKGIEFVMGRKASPAP